MSSDPAVLFYIGDWLKSTAEMDADVRGWYLNLLLHNYDKSDLPNDLEKLASLASVKFSEYNRFEQVFEQVLKQKFEQNENGRLTNPKMSDIIKSREVFKNKRSNAGKVSYVMRYMAKHFTKEYKNSKLKNFVKDNFDYSIDLKDEQVFKQVFKQVFELYRNENEDENIIKNKDVNELYSTSVMDCYYSCLEYFDESLHPDTESKKNNWLDAIDKLNRIDGLKFEDIKHLVQVTREHDFWSKNFLSIPKLRKKDPNDLHYWKVFYNKFKNQGNGTSTKSRQESIARANWGNE